MCGIVGCSYKGDCYEAIYKSLLALEYRGYDSAGIACLDGNTLRCVKKRGRVKNLARYSLPGKTGIGHTRWATHGKPSDVNAHPHVYGKFALVHNGIIENYRALQDECGEAPLSSTDSEVIVRLIARYYDGNFLFAVNRALSRLEGSYAIAVICSDYPDTIVCARNQSPLLVGYGEGSWIASDVQALFSCASYTALADGEVAVLKGEEISFYDAALNPVKKSFLPVKRPRRPVGELSCHMQAEIAEIPQAMKNTYAYLTRHPFDRALFASFQRCFVVGCGTAFHSGLVFQRLAVECNLPVRAELASEFRYTPRVYSKDDLIVAVTQSGETADTVKAVERAKAGGAKVIAVTNNARSAITALADDTIAMRAGPEIAVCATKSYNCQLLCLYYLLGEIVHARYGSYPLWFSALQELDAPLPSYELRPLVRLCKRARGIFFIGRGLDYCAAREGALKLKEIAYLFAEGYPAGELKHGSLALIDRRVPAVAVITQRATAEKTQSAIAEIRARGGKVALFSQYQDVLNASSADYKYLLPATDEALMPCFAVVPLQLLALSVCRAKGYHPDYPRNLAKSVTVE